MAIDGAYQGYRLNPSATGGGGRSGGAWPLGRRSVVRAEQQLHRDLGRASYALRDVGQGDRQGHPDGRLRAHQAGEEATKGAVKVADLGPGKGTYGSSSLYVGDQNRRLFLRSAKPVAARVEREHQRPAETVLSEGHRLVGALTSHSEQSGSSAQRTAT